MIKKSAAKRGTVNKLMVKVVVVVVVVVAMYPL